MSCHKTYLADPTGATWLVSVDENGILSSTLQAGAAVTAQLSDAAGVVWLVGITAGGLLTTTVVSGLATGRILQFYSPLRKVFNVTVSTGGLLMIVWSGITIPTYAVGDLYPGSAQFARAVQPGGSGTIVTQPPQPQPNERTGRFQPGCGHSVNSYDIYEYDNGDCSGPAALVTCPVCSYIQRIIVPFSSIYDNVANEIIVA